MDQIQQNRETAEDYSLLYCCMMKYFYHKQGSEMVRISNHTEVYNLMADGLEPWQAARIQYRKNFVGLPLPNYAKGTPIRVGTPKSGYDAFNPPSIDIFAKLPRRPMDWTPVLEIARFIKTTLVYTFLFLCICMLVLC